MGSLSASTEAKLSQAQERFLQYLASGRYREAESFLTTLRINARAERNKEIYYTATYFLGVCYQQEGRLEDAKIYLAEVAKESSSSLIAIKSRLHLGKVYSQDADYAQATIILSGTLREITALEAEGKLRPEDALHLKLPILWRLGVEETITGQKLLGERHKERHWELSNTSPYQLANALACRAILFGSGESDTPFDEVEESLKEASDTYINAPEDETTSFAFRDKAFIGMILLEAILDFHAGRKFSSYAKLHIVRHYMITWGILPSSEGFAEMIQPALHSFPQLLEFLSVSEFLYEQWVTKQHDAKLYFEARGHAAELRSLMESKGKTGYRAEFNNLNSAILGRDRKVFILDEARISAKSTTYLNRSSPRETGQMEGAQRKRFYEALIDAFPTVPALKRVVSFGMSENLEVMAGTGRLGDIAFNLIEWAESQGRTEELIVAARNENPRNLKMRRFAEEVMLAPSSAELESIVLKSVKFEDVEEWRVQMIKNELCVCRVEIPVHEGIGTGFLLGADIIMTNYHVLEEVIESHVPSSDVSLRFDYKQSAEGKVVAPGKEYRLVEKDWLVDYSPASELDYALVQVDGAPGAEPISGQHGAPERGWLTAKRNDFNVGDPLFIIQHPKADPLKFAVGSVTEVRSGQRRVRYTANTLAGSSGSPCFTANWELVALHRAGGSSYNEGIPFSYILAQLTMTITTP